MRTMGYYGGAVEDKGNTIQSEFKQFGLITDNFMNTINDIG